MKLVFLDVKTLGEVPNLSILEQFGDIVLYQTTAAGEIQERVHEADIVITNKVVLDRRTLLSAPRLKLICVAATGTNNIDKETASERGISVKNAVDYSSNSVAQTTFALLLQLINRISFYDSYVKQGGYAKNDIFTYLGKPFTEICGKRFGIIGLGHIGRQVARIAQAFGAEIVYYSASGQTQDQPYQRLEWEPFLTTCDIISVHAPLNSNTRNLLRKETLSFMKETALLLNVSRGGIINEHDLAWALDHGVIAGAGLDVFEQEPIHADNPLLTLKRKDCLVLTPHIAWSSIESRTLLLNKIYENIRAFIETGR